ncbi:MAG: wax ester/triacylglycerol synthase family O-acyltransferase [Halioglobus sp.]|nr:wax ester/triacylglycerol synthase family O-acyltransferase [Halioglobus sp.]
MKQLGILDSAFVNLEQTNTPQHVGGLGIYDPSTAPGGFVRFKDVIASFERRLSNLPLFRTRLVEVPGGLDRPYWVKDANFDVEFHLRHIALPEPGDWRQLCIQVARLHSRPLDMSRPLWEAYIIEGLDNIPNLPAGCFAVYTKMHHSLVDGAGGASFMTALHDLVPNPDHSNDPDGLPRLVDTTPSVGELMTKATINNVKNTFQLITGTARTARDLGKYALDIARKEIPAPDVSAPKTILNKPVGPHRVFDAAEFPLEGFKDIKNAVGVTVNDVALGVVSGALLRYLTAKNEAPKEGSLAATLPLNMRTRRSSTEENNQVGAVFASLHTDISDPLERLVAIKQSTDTAKDSGEASPMVDALKLAGVFSPVISKTVASFWARNELSRHIPLNISTCISNVPGPNFPLYCAGARMVDYYGLGVLTPGMGIFHLVFSYSGKITLSVLADRDIMPDPEFYHDCLVAAYEELYAAAHKLGPRRPKDAAVAAKAKIQSPKRTPAAVRRNTGTPAPKLRSKASATTGAATAAKSGVKKRAKAASKKAGTTTRKKTGNKARGGKSTAAARPKLGRRGTGAAKPKLK